MVCVLQSMRVAARANTMGGMSRNSNRLITGWFLVLMGAAVALLPGRAWSMCRTGVGTAITYGGRHACSGSPGRSAAARGDRATGGGHLWSRAHTNTSSRESLSGRPEMVVSPQRSQQVSTTPEGRPRWEKGAKML
jgi:hypothetical protein